MLPLGSHTARRSSLALAAQPGVAAPAIGRSMVQRTEVNVGMQTVAEPPAPPAPQARLMPPRLGRGILPRPRLARRLADEDWPPLALAIAPAGFGKTTLLSQWHAAVPFPAAWLTADPDDDLPAFVRGMLAALSRTAPEAGFPASLTALAVGESSPERLADALSDDLVDGSDRLLLVVDDCDRISDPAVIRFLARLLRHPVPGCTLALGGRTELPLPTVLLRGRGGLVEVGAADLLFTDEEAGAACASAGLDAEATAAVRDLARGWPVAVRLLSASRRAADGPAIARAGGEASATEFLLAEIVRPLSADRRRVLAIASIAERTPLALIERLAVEAGVADAGLLLDQAARATALVARDDADPPAVRCHPLLRRALAGDGAAGDWLGAHGPHAAASAWFAERGMVAEAVAQAVAAADSSAAARIVEDAARAGGDVAPSATWLALLPPRLVADRPRLLLAAARLACLRGSLDDAADGVDRAVALLSRAAPPDAATLGEAHAVACAIRCRRGDFAGAADDARVALALLPGDGAHAALRAAVMPDLVVAATLAGRGADAAPLLAAALDACGDDGPAGISLMLALGIANALPGKLDEAETALRRLTSLARGARAVVESSAHGHLWRGRVCYQRNRLAEAAGCFGAVLDLGDVADPSTRREAAMGAALAAIAGGRRQDAEPALAALAADAASGSPVARSFVARVALIDGDLAAAARWLADADATHAVLAVSLESPCLTEVRVRLALGGRLQAEHALLMLRNLADRPDVRFIRERAVEACALEALAHEAAGDAEAAEQAVVRLLALAESGRFVRAILDAGPAILPLLARHPQRFGAGPFLADLTDAARRSRGGRNAGGRLSPDPGGPASGLSHREREVLAGLARRLTDKEIAQALRISPLTVKRHASNLYAKLGATGRRDAVGKARALGFALDERADPLTDPVGLR